MLLKASPMMNHLRKQGSTTLRLVLLGAGTMASVSCGDDPVGQPTEGTILVAATTVGTDFDPNGYTVSVNNGQPAVIGTLDTVFVNDLAAGNYQVSLGGIASNCSTVAGENPVTVAVVPADTVNAEFEVTCEVPPPPDDGGGDPVP
jgi:hypothetical protein